MNIFDKIVYNNVEYTLYHIIKEIYQYGYTRSIVRSDKYAWIKKRKKMYATEAMVKILNIKTSDCNRFFKENNSQSIIGLNYGESNRNLIKENICDNNAIIKKDKIDSLDMVTKDIYKKYMYPNKIISTSQCEKIKEHQNLSYNIILPEHHYSYDLFHKEILSLSNANIYKDIIELLDYYVPEGEDYREFCYLLLGEETAEDYVRQLLDDTETQPIFYYGKFGGNDDTRRAR